MNGEIKALSKERPRTGKGGHFFTPKRTREYERAIKEMAEVFVMEPPVDFPVAFTVLITHKVAKSWPDWKANLAQANLISPNRGDLDNKVKAISDALNGIVFLDDVQICWLKAEMRYGSKELIEVLVTRAGYTIEEARRLNENFSRERP
jgi:Holliday junction resolvase RusA-like endonuclease